MYRCTVWRTGIHVKESRLLQDAIKDKVSFINLIRPIMLEISVPTLPASAS